jgi:malate synthase
VIAADNELVRVTGRRTEAQSRVLTPEALRFLAKLSNTFESRRQRVLEARKARQQEIDEGRLPEFPAETEEIREGSWRVASIPADLMDRRVEITGPTDRKMIINALNSGSKVFMADFEDSNSPTWENLMEGQSNLMDAVRGTITYDSPEGKHYELADETAVLMVSRRLASGGEALPDRWPAYFGVAVRLRFVLLPQCQGADFERHRSVLLPAQAGEPV